MAIKINTGASGLPLKFFREIIEAMPLTRGVASLEKSERLHGEAGLAAVESGKPLPATGLSISTEED